MEAFTEKEAEIRASLSQQVETFLNLMDHVVAREYRQAKEDAPNLVNREAQVIDFLHVEDFHPLRAAKRMALYWKFRKTLFGADRWLLPMTSTGAGALNMEDIAVLRSGYLIGGHNTWVLDLSRSPTDDFLFLRVQFYTTSLTAWARPRVPPANIIWAIHDSKCTAMNAMRSKECQDFIQCMPFKIGSITVALTYQPGREALLDYLGYKQQKILQATTNRSNVQMVATHSLATTVRALQDRGADRKFLPHCLGGDYDYERDLCDFIRTRLTLEDAMIAAPPIRNSNLKLRLLLPPAPVVAAAAVARVTRAHTSSTLLLEDSHVTENSTAAAKAISSNDEDSNGSLKQSADTPSASATTTPTATTTTTTTRPAVKHKRVPHSMQQTAKLRRLQEQCQSLRNSNESLRNNSRRLEGVLSQARLLVAMFQGNGGGGSSPSMIVGP